MFLGARRLVVIMSLACMSACVPGGPGVRQLPGEAGANSEDNSEDEDGIGEGQGGTGGELPGEVAGPTWWDDIEPIVRRECGSCHGAVPTAGSPSSLITYEDMMGISDSDPTRLAYEVSFDRIRRTDSAKPPMPPRGLTAQEIALFERWTLDGAPEGTFNGKPTEEPIDPGEEPNMGGTDIPGEMPYSDLTVLAPQAAVRAGREDFYGCFRTIARVPSAMHAVEITPVIDNPAIVHHILLFRDSTRRYPEQKSGLLCALDTVSRNWELLHGWAPGGGPMVMPPEAGVRVQDGDYLIVQIHYNNPTANAVLDSSGMRFKMTSRLRANDAAVTGVGTEGFTLPPGQASVTASGNCTLNKAITMFSYSPHMHLLGTAMSLEKVSGGQTTMVADVPRFTFEGQSNIAKSEQFQAGDVLRANCTWNTTGRTGNTGFGEGTTDEMCYMFVAHYPPLGTFSCTD